MPIYSFGLDSPLKFELSEGYVDAYNRALTVFFLAQETHFKTTGSRWNPSMSLLIEWEDDERAAFNAFNDILKKALELHGTPVHQDELTDDFLVKN